jgi:predicted nucleic acid-binding protein
LGSGERTCIAIAVHRQGLFASDDLDARREARARNVALTGTLGILIAQVKRNRLSLAEGNALLNALIGQNYRSPVTRLDELILSENK